MFSFLLRQNLRSAKLEVIRTTVGELMHALTAVDPAREAVVYADLEGEWVQPLPYHDERAVVCGYYTAEKVCVTAEAAVIVTGAEQAF